jgi:poly(3-hydroxyalkanoate) synthetase
VLTFWLESAVESKNSPSCVKTLLVQIDHLGYSSLNNQNSQIGKKLEFKKMQMKFQREVCQGGTYYIYIYII